MLVRKFLAPFAMIALVLAGRCPDLPAAAAFAAPPRASFTPIPEDTAALAGAYRRYRRLADQLAPLATTPWR